MMVVLDYLYNRDAFVEFERSYFYNMVFGICHELGHRIEEHFEAKILAECPNQMLSNVAGDAYLNMTLKDMLYDPAFVTRRVSPALGIGDDDMFGGSKGENFIHPDLVGKPFHAIFSVIVDELQKSSGRKVVGQYDKAGLGSEKIAVGSVILKIEYPQKSFSKVFDNKSDGLIRFVHNTVLRIMTKPQKIGEPPYTPSTTPDGDSTYGDVSDTPPPGGTTPPPGGYKPGDVIWSDDASGEVYVVVKAEDDRVTVEDIDPNLLPKIDTWLGDHYRKNPDLTVVRNH
jgi:hypothetical protein